MHVPMIWFVSLMARDTVHGLKFIYYLSLVWVRVHVCE